MSEGVRPRKLWHWAVIAVVAATVYANPGGSVELAITVLDKAGSTVGGGLRAVGYDGESDYFSEPVPEAEGDEVPLDEDDDPAEDESPEPVDPSSVETSASGIIFGPEAPAELHLHGTADWAVAEIVGLHQLVEALLESPSAPTKGSP